ncbi:hypothetical protein UAJ10_20425 [Nitrospirillum sp. BR 11164]|uniref:hypothetical protein n=1 Tax=Nitrospirillum sp. BR 11164 TaxID=3104324 RepID=UPI002AFF8658|nr:hypothetical protein [Nitrospirillum sp. BR 11164]MEA1651371.1 hypothetical protein [Nitrospirillum sp. BR 11164]
METITADCPNCGLGRNVIVLKREIENKLDEYLLVEDSYEYLICKCAGCDYIFFRKERTNSEESEMEIDPITGEEKEILHYRVINFYPGKEKMRPDWLDIIYFFESEIYESLDKIYRTLDASSFDDLPASCRMAIDKIIIYLGVPENLPFSKKTEELLNRSQMTEHDKKILDIIINATNAAIHRNWKPESLFY